MTIRYLSIAIACTLLPLRTAVFAAESPSYAAEGNNISYFNTPNRDGTAINGTEPTDVARVTLTLSAEADVLVQFTSEVAAEESTGCPCSIRANLKIDNGEPLVIKRINVGAPAVQTVDKYEHDRQNVDGSYVFRLAAGKHTIALTYHQVDGKGTALEVFYPNLQAVVFPRR